MSLIATPAEELAGGLAGGLHWAGWQRLNLSL